MEHEKNDLEQERLALENEKLRIEVNQLKQKKKWLAGFSDQNLRVFGAVLLGIPLAITLYYQISQPIMEAERIKSEKTSLEIKLEQAKERLEIQDERTRNKNFKDSLAIEIKKREQEYFKVLKKLDSIHKSSGLGESVSGIGSGAGMRTRENSVRKEIERNIYHFTFKSTHIQVPVYSVQTLQDLLNLLFEKYLKNEVEVFSYGKKWEIWTAGNNKKRIEKLAGFDERDIKDSGIKPGEQYIIQLIDQ